MYLPFIGYTTQPLYSRNNANTIKRNINSLQNPKKFKIPCLFTRKYNLNNGYKTKKPEIQSNELRTYFGWDGWIRTSAMPESKSGALPLGYTPSCNF